MSIDVDEVIASLKASGGFVEAYQVTTFKGYRRNSHGEQHEVTVEISDAGQAANPHVRYRAVATSDDGEGHRKRVAGGSESSVQDALMHFRWEALDTLD
jgi:hypothetical protein